MDRDVTERILAEKAFRESEERFRFMVETTGDVIYRLRYDTMTYDYLSPGIGKLTGYSPEEIKTIGFSSLVTRLDLPGQEDVSTKAILADRLAGKTGEYRADYLITTKTGTSKWLRDHSFPWYDDSGKNIGSVGILSDSTDYKQAEERLREAEEKYRTIFNGALEGIYQTSAEGQFLVANPALAQILGYDSPEEVISTITDSAHQIWVDPNQAPGLYPADSSKTVLSLIMNANFIVKTRPGSGYRSMPAVLSGRMEKRFISQDS